MSNSDVPSGWVQASISDVAILVRGVSYSKKDASSSGRVGYVPLLRATNISGASLTFEGLVHVPDSYVSADQRLRHGDVVIASSSGSKDVVGKAGQYFCQGADLSFGAFCTVIRPVLPISSRYLGLYFESPGYREAISEVSAGSSINNIKTSELSAHGVPVAPIEEQVRIVEKLEELLSDLDAGVAELKTVQRKLAQYRQSLLKAAVEGALTADWRVTRAASGELQETGAALLQRILIERRVRWEQKQLAKFAEQGKSPSKDWQSDYVEPIGPDATALPSLPQGWAWATIDQLAFVVRGASPRPAGDPHYFGGDIPWITVGSLTAEDGMFLDKVEQFVTEAGKDASRYIDPDTLLLTNSGATLGVPKITRIGGCINDGSVALFDVDEPLKTYLYWFLRTQTKRLRALNQGAAQPNLNTGIVRRICVPICQLEEMTRINMLLDQQVETARLQEVSIEYGLKQAAAQRKNILKAAFTGQLVPQDPNDEPASMLLERIRATRAQNADTRKKRGRKTKETA